MNQFPLLGPEDIEVKVKQVSQKGAVALLYKTARTDMEMLDKTVGPENWECDYEEIKGNLYCTIAVRCGDMWVRKQDCGIESREDSEGNQKKGEASDAFKRAGFKWGIGRELYSSPFIFLPLPTEKKEIGGRTSWVLKDPFQRYEVADIQYDANRRVSALRIVDSKTRDTVYSYGVKQAPKAPQQAPKAPQPKRESVPATVSVANQTVLCADCGNPIEAVDYRGQRIEAATIAKSSKTRYGRCLCFACASKAKETA